METSLGKIDELDDLKEVDLSDDEATIVKSASAVDRATMSTVAFSGDTGGGGITISKPKVLRPRQVKFAASVDPSPSTSATVVAAAAAAEMTTASTSAPPLPQTPPPSFTPPPLPMARIKTPVKEPIKDLVKIPPLQSQLTKQSSQHKIDIPPSKVSRSSSATSDDNGDSDDEDDKYEDNRSYFCCLCCRVVDGIDRQLKRLKRALWILTASIVFSFFLEMFAFLSMEQVSIGLLVLMISTSISFAVSIFQLYNYRHLFRKVITPVDVNTAAFVHATDPVTVATRERYKKNNRLLRRYSDRLNTVILISGLLAFVAIASLGITLIIIVYQLRVDTAEEDERPSGVFDTFRLLTKNGKSIFVMHFINAAVAISSFITILDQGSSIKDRYLIDYGRYTQN